MSSEEIQSGISTIYHVSVTVPDEVSDFLMMERLDVVYEQEMIEATRYNIGAGCNSYSEVVEWADFSTWHQADAARDRMVSVVAKYLALAQQQGSN